MGMEEEKRAKELIKAQAVVASLWAGAPVTEMVPESQKEQILSRYLSPAHSKICPSHG